MKNPIFFEKNYNSRKSNGIQNKNEKNEIFIVKNYLTPRKSDLKDSKVKFITKKSFNERTECKNKPSDNCISNEGRWSEEEHEKFLKGIVIYGINWKKVKTLIETRTNMQVRSHAQKFFYKMKLCKDESLGIDFTSNTIRNIKDMINEIKNNNYNFNIINVFKYLAYKYGNLEKIRKSKNIALKRSELSIQSNIINLKEDNSNINDNNIFFNQINNINKQKRTKEAQNINSNELNDILKVNNQNNILNLLHNILIINYNSNVINFLLQNNLYSSTYDITNNINKLLINYLISNNYLNAPNIINENALLSLTLQNNILNYIKSINYVHNNNLNDINFYTNFNNYNIIRNINNENNNIDEKDNIYLRNNNNNDYNDNIGNKDNKNYNININKNAFFFCSDKHLNKINDKKNKNNNENSGNNIIFN